MAPIIGAAAAPIMGAVSALTEDPAAAVQTGIKLTLTYGGLAMGLLGVRGYWMQRDGEKKPEPFDAFTAPAKKQPANAGKSGKDVRRKDLSREGSVSQWILDGFKLSGAFPPTEEYLTRMRERVMQESEGDPNAVNDWDTNAAKGTPSKGLVQIIEPTWKKHAPAPYKDFDKYWNKPRINVATSLNYMKAMYGRILGATGSGY